MEGKMKTINVVAAIIVDDDKILTTQRGYGDFKGMWEFPGGKIEAGESPEEALKREINEELNVTIEVGEFVKKIEYDYPQFHLSMECFICKIEAGKLELKEHQQAKWVTKDTIDNVNWLPADVELIPKLKKRLSDEFY